MWRYDFHLFYLAGQAVLNGTSPYTIPDFNPPYFLALFFAPFALLPEKWAYFLFIGFQIYLLWRILGKRSIWALLAFPVWFDLFVGQIDLFLTLLTLTIGPWVIPLLLLKPQIGYVLAPWLIFQNRKNLNLILKISVLSIGFILLSFLIRPTWFIEWRAVIPTVKEYAQRDSNLYWLVPTNFKNLAVIIGTPLGLLLGLIWIKDRRVSWSILHLFAPLTNIYSASVLAEWIGPLEVFLSWIAILVVGGIHNGAPLFGIALSILFKNKISKGL